MKKTITIILMALCLNSFAEQDTRQTTYIFNKTANAIEHVYMDGTKVVEKAYQAGKTYAPKIEAALQSLSKTLQVSANEVWDILIRQQLVMSWAYLLVFLMTIFSWAHFWFRYNNGIKNNWGGKDSGSYELACVITFCLAIIGTIVDFNIYEAMFTGFFNPKYGAMKTIAEIASQIK